MLLAAAAPAPTGAEETALTFHYLYRPDDGFYAPHEAYTGLVLRDRHRPIDGVKTALREARVLARSLGMTFTVAESPLAPGADAVATVRALRRDGALTVVLPDLPTPEIAALGRAFAGASDVMVFNIRSDADSLRGADCSPVLFHTMPSLAMTADAMAQGLAQRGWTRVLLLVGEADEDAVTADAFDRAARKFGLAIVDRRDFVLGNDPRRRDQNNIALLTGDARYDVVYLADSAGEFGRYVPYATQDPRPVVGSEGLAPSAWHWTLERYGAPQLNQRFDRVAARAMTGLDWAAWAAVKSVLEAVARTQSLEPGAVRGHLLSEEFSLDLYKGAAGSFRPWDLQLRQPMVLHTHNAVIALAPFEAFLHATNTLDSLGIDAPETACEHPTPFP